MPVSRLGDLVSRHPHRPQDALIQRGSRVEAADLAGKGEAQVGFLGLAGMLPAIDAQQSIRLEMMRRFLERLPSHRFDQRFALLQMPGWLVEFDAFVGVLFYQQKLAVLFNDGGDNDVGFPDFLGH